MKALTYPAPTRGRFSKTALFAQFFWQYFFFSAEIYTGVH